MPNKEKNGETVDWSKFGLGSSEEGEVRQNGDFGSGGHQPTGPNELFAGEHVRSLICFGVNYIKCIINVL